MPIEVIETDGSNDPFPEETALEAQEAARPVAVKKNEPDDVKTFVTAPEETHSEPAESVGQAAIKAASELAAAKAEAERSRAEADRIAILARQAIENRVVSAPPPPVVEVDPLTELGNDDYTRKVAGGIEQRIRKALKPYEDILPRIADASEQAQFTAKYGSKIGPDLFQKVEQIRATANHQGVHINRDTALKIALGESQLENLGKTAPPNPATVARNRSAAAVGGEGTPGRETTRRGRAVDVDSLPREKRLAALEADLENVGF